MSGVAASTGDAGGTVPGAGLSRDQVIGFARLALDCVQREYPNSIQHVLGSAGDVQPPRALHPAFYGCLDWHSAVHGHWLLVRLLRTLPELPEAAAIRAALDANLTAAHLAVEVAYFAAPHRRGFERPYGWAWLLKLADELHAWASEPGTAGVSATGNAIAGAADARRWAAVLAPLVDVIAERYLEFLPRQTYPVRTGVHANTAFGLSFALDHARRVGHAALEALIVGRARDYYAGDRDAPAAWEPGGEDFLSPVLVEADLMRRVLPPPDFVGWLHGFLPHGLPPALQRPAIVSDRSDGKLAHLDGLNLSRAWCLRSVANALSAASEVASNATAADTSDTSDTSEPSEPSEPSKPSERASGPRDAENADNADDATRMLRDQLAAAAAAHTAAGLANVATGDYAGEHWLATFAVYLGSV